MKTILNAEQKVAVQHTCGPLLVIAGAGTGKTRVITERIIYLIKQKKYLPQSILALTFTEKAAREMEERVDISLPLGAHDTWIMTFHSFCDRVLRESAIELALAPDFQVLTEAESLRLLAEVVVGLDLSLLSPPNNPTKFLQSILSYLNRLQDELIDVAKLTQFFADQQWDSEEEKHKAEDLVSIYKEYQAIKKRQDLLDYADLITYTYQAFKSNNIFKKRYQQQFKMVLVDEFQDTNYAQIKLLEALVADDKNIMVVGDDDQSIFRWRGAAVFNVLEFEQYFPGAKTITLVDNYRSPQKLLDCAYRLIQHNNPHRLENKIGVSKRLKAQLDEKGELKIIKAVDEEEEAVFVAQEIKSLIEKGYLYNDIAVLVRANHHGDSFARRFSLERIPYQRSGVDKWYHEPIVKDLIAYVMLIANPFDDIYFYRFLTSPHLSISGVEISKIVNQARKSNKSLYEVAKQSFSIEVMELLQKHLTTPRRRIGELLYEYIYGSGLLERLKDGAIIQDVKDARLISRLFEEVSRFEKNSLDPCAYSFSKYLDLVYATSGSSEDFDLEENSVKILTIHASKGLEFPVVFMVNLVKGRFPSVNKHDSLLVPETLIKEKLSVNIADLHLQEERRLFYVGLTRAKAIIYFTFADKYGVGKRYRKMSPFVTEALDQSLEKYMLKTVHHLPMFHMFINDKYSDIKGTYSTPINRLEYISYSHLDTFNVCPLQYKYRYVLKIPAIRSAAASYGTALHETLRDFYTGLKIGKKWNRKKLLALYQSYWSAEGYESREHEARSKKEGELALSEYYNKQHHPNQLPLYIEKQFLISFKSISIKGVIDRIDQLSDGTIEIIDYKTSKPLTSIQLKKDLQLSLYAMVVSSPQFLGVPLAKQKVSIYNFQDHNKRTSTRSKEDIEILKKHIEGVVEEINQSKFPPKVSPLCKYCSYQMLCDAYQGDYQH